MIYGSEPLTKNKGDIECVLTEQKNIFTSSTIHFALN